MAQTGFKPGPRIHVRNEDMFTDKDPFWSRLLYLIVCQHQILATVPLSTTLSDELILYAPYHTSNIGLNSYCFEI